MLKITVESYKFDLYTCAWIENWNQRTYGNIKAMSIHARMLRTFQCGVRDSKYKREDKTAHLKKR